MINKIKNNLKDYLTDIVAIFLLFLEPVSALLIENREINLKNLLGYLLLAIVSYATGKNKKLKRDE